MGVFPSDNRNSGVYFQRHRKRRPSSHPVAEKCKDLSNPPAAKGMKILGKLPARNDGYLRASVVDASDPLMRNRWRAIYSRTAAAAWR
jgi:hypothetical protein